MSNNECGCRSVGAFESAILCERHLAEARSAVRAWKADRFSYPVAADDDVGGRGVVSVRSDGRAPGSPYGDTSPETPADPEIVPCTT